MRPRLILDADGVLFDLVGYLQKDVQYRFGLDLGNPKEYDLAHWTEDEAVGRHIIRSLHSAVVYRQLEPYPDAVEVVPELARHYDIYVVSARPARTLAASITRTQECFPMIRGVYHTRRKVRVARLLKAWWAVDDHLGTVRQYLRKRIKAWLLCRYFLPEGLGFPRPKIVTDLRQLLPYLVRRDNDATVP